MRFPSSHSRCLLSATLLLTTLPLRAQSPPPTVEIRQLQQIKQGSSGWFHIEANSPVTLRLEHLAGTGAASFEDGSSEFHLSKSADVEVYGSVASDLAADLSLSAWLDNSPTPAATAFFDVIASTPDPRIFWGAQDITGSSQSVVVGQQLLLNVTLHPSLEILTETWTIEPQGDYVGGFVHTPARGGPQPVTRNGPSITLYWVRPGLDRRITYRVTTADGQSASATVHFDVQGPSLRDVMVVQPIDITVRPGDDLGSSYMDFAGSGIWFQAHYNLPAGLLRNYTWAQVVTQDLILIRIGADHLVCRPQSDPQAELGAALDTDYPYDWHNPVRDSPPIQLQPDMEEVSRDFHARMYLLWGSGMSNSIVVPLGYVPWHFQGHVIRKDLLANSWTLLDGSGGPDDPAHPYRSTRSYPTWSAVIPYSGQIHCHH